MARQPAFLAVDIGGTKMACGIVATDGTLLHSDRCTTPATGVLDALADLVTRTQQRAVDHELVALGVGCGGPMSDQGDRVSNLHIKEWQEFPLRSSLASLTGLATFVDNDAKAIVLG